MRRAMTAVLGVALLAACGGGGGGGDGDDDGPIEVSNVQLTPSPTASGDRERCDISAIVRNVGPLTCDFVSVTFFGLDPADPSLRIAESTDFLGPIPPGEARTYDGSMIRGVDDFINCDEFIRDERIQVSRSTDC